MAKLAFVVGFPRSGTTFLATKLGELANCAATPETRFFAEVVDERMVFSHTLTAREIRNEIVHFQRLKDLELNLEALFPEPDDARFETVEVFRRIMAAFATAHGVDVVVEKSPAHTYFISSLLEWFPEAKFIAIVRDGRDALLSLRETPWGDLSAPHYAADWVFRNGLIAKAARQHPDRVRVVRFEDLVKDQEAVVDALGSWLGLDPEAAHEGKGIKTIPDWEAGWKRKAAGAADSTRAGRWQSETDDKEIVAFTAIAGDTLRKFGYRAPVSTRAGRLMAYIFPARYVAKRIIRKALILAGLGRSISSQLGLEKRLDMASRDETV